MAINFGTDGWRAVISEEFTFDNVRKVAQAIAEKTLADVSGGNRPGFSQAAPPDEGRRLFDLFVAQARLAQLAAEIETGAVGQPQIEQDQVRVGSVRGSHPGAAGGMPSDPKVVRLQGVHEALADGGVIFGTGFAPFTGGPLNYQETKRQQPVARAPH